VNYLITVKEKPKSKYERFRLSVIGRDIRALRRKRKLKRIINRFEFFLQDIFFLNPFFARKYSFVERKYLIFARKYRIFARTWHIIAGKFYVVERKNQIFARTCRIIARTRHVIERKFYKIARKFRVNAADNRDNGRIYSLQNGNLCYIVGKIQLKINTMPQTENPKPRTRRAKPPAPNPEPKPQCHIHDKVGNRQVENIRANVCVNDEDFTEYKGKHYCLFHLPTKDKDIQKFENKFRNRLEEVEQNLAKIKKLPEEEQAEAKAKLS